MKVSKACDARHLLVQTRVVLHGARPERIHALIDRVVPGRHPGEVANYVNFTNLRDALEIVVTAKLSWHQFIQGSFVNIERRQTITDPTRLGALEDQRLVVTDMRSDFGDIRFHLLTGSDRFQSVNQG